MPEAYFFISSIRNIIGQEGTFMDKKRTKFFIWNMAEKGTKKPEAYFIILSIKNII